MKKKKLLSDRMKAFLSFWKQRQTSIAQSVKVRKAVANNPLFLQSCTVRFGTNSDEAMNQLT